MTLAREQQKAGPEQEEDAGRASQPHGDARFARSPPAWAGESVGVGGGSSLDYGSGAFTPYDGGALTPYNSGAITPYDNGDWFCDRGHSAGLEPVEQLPKVDLAPADREDAIPASSAAASCSSSVRRQSENLMEVAEKHKKKELADLRHANNDLALELQKLAEKMQESLLNLASAAKTKGDTTKNQPMDQCDTMQTKLKKVRQVQTKLKKVRQVVLEKLRQVVLDTLIQVPWEKDRYDFQVVLKKDQNDKHSLLADYLIEKAMGMFLTLSAYARNVYKRLQEVRAELGRMVAESGEKLLTRARDQEVRVRDCAMEKVNDVDKRIWGVISHYEETVKGLMQLENAVERGKLTSSGAAALANGTTSSGAKDEHSIGAQDSEGASASVGAQDSEGASASVGSSQCSILYPKTGKIDALPAGIFGAGSRLGSGYERRVGEVIDAIKTLCQKVQQDAMAYSFAWNYSTSSDEIREQFQGWQGRMSNPLKEIALMNPDPRTGWYYSYTHDFYGMLSCVGNIFKHIEDRQKWGDDFHSCGLDSNDTSAAWGVHSGPSREGESGNGAADEAGKLRDDHDPFYLEDPTARPYRHLEARQEVFRFAKTHYDAIDDNTEGAVCAFVWFHKEMPEFTNACLEVYKAIEQFLDAEGKRPIMARLRVNRNDFKDAHGLLHRCIQWHTEGLQRALIAIQAGADLNYKNKWGNNIKDQCDWWRSRLARSQMPGGQSILHNAARIKDAVLQKEAETKLAAVVEEAEDDDCPEDDHCSPQSHPRVAVSGGA
eukprot:g3563.t1